MRRGGGDLIQVLTGALLGPLCGGPTALVQVGNDVLDQERAQDWGEAGGF